MTWVIHRLLLLLLVSATTSLTRASTASVVDSAVFARLQHRGRADVVVSLEEPRGSAGLQRRLRELEADTNMSRGQRIERMVHEMEAHTTSRAAVVFNSLVHSRSRHLESSRDATYEKASVHWITNEIILRGATYESIHALKDMAAVSHIRLEQVAQIPAVHVSAELNHSTARALQSIGELSWGIRKVGASNVWRRGYEGSGIVVGSIDTGVHYQHEALQANFRSTYGWYDPEWKSEQPYDIHGHGTHTMGILAGRYGIGVAPAATWMSCKACRAEGCTEDDILSCAEFMMCPTDSQGANQDCSKAPQVVSYSLAGERGQTYMRRVFERWLQAGIMPVVATGNDGPECSTANAPGDVEFVLTVGATDMRDSLIDMSSRGPTWNGTVKPDVVAPGYLIRSAFPDGDAVDVYAEMDGTSMATPHVAGVAALLRQAFPQASYDQIKQAITESASKRVDLSWPLCSPTHSASNFPNNLYGHGRLDARAAFLQLDQSLRVVR